jgi:hypothetical protein
MRHITTPLILGTLLALAAMTIFGGYSLRLRSYPVDLELIPRSSSALAQPPMERR